MLSSLRNVGNPGNKWGFRHAIIFLIPAIFFAIAIQLYPIIYAFYVSLHEAKFLDVLGFVGLKNYKTVLSTPELYKAIYKSLQYVIGSLILSITVGLSISLLLNNLKKYQNILRSFFLLPWSLSQAVVASLIVWLLNPSYGPINWILMKIGINDALLLSNPSTAMIWLILTNVWWSVAISILNFSAALKTIPNELYDALSIDGGGKIAAFWSITLPMLRSTIMSTIIILSILYFHMVTLIYVLTGGGPIEATKTLSISVFLEGFRALNMQKGVIFAIILFLITMIVDVFYVVVLGRRESIY